MSTEVVANIKNNPYYLPPHMQSAAVASPQPAAGGAAKSAAVAGGAAGSLAGPVGMILGAVAGATIGGIFDAIQGNQNRKMMQRQQNEARDMAERQWNWSQNIDRFNVRMQNRQQNETEKMNRHKLSQDRVERINEALKIRAAAQDRGRSIWGRG